MFTIDAYLQDIENVLELNSKNLIDKLKEIDNQMILFSTFYEENAETIVPKEQEVIKDWFKDCFQERLFSQRL